MTKGGPTLSFPRGCLGGGAWEELGQKVSSSTEKGDWNGIWENQEVPKGKN